MSVLKLMQHGCFDVLDVVSEEVVPELFKGAACLL